MLACRLFGRAVGPEAAVEREAAADRQRAENHNRGEISGEEDAHRGLIFSRMRRVETPQGKGSTIDHKI